MPGTTGPAGAGLGREAVTARGVVLGVVVAAMLTIPVVPSAAAEDTTTRSENFSITYSTDPNDRDAPELADEDADGVPDVVERILAEFEAARAFEIEVLGYRPPPNDGDYPLYIAGAVDNAYTRALPSGTERSRPSYIVIPPSVIRSEVPDPIVAAFAAHEYMHAIQHGYDSGEDIWIKEASAAWVEDVYVDAADPNHYLVPGFVSVPREPLTSIAGLHEYGAFLFLQFLSERYAGGSTAGAQLVRELWEAMAAPETGGAGSTSLEAIGRWLTERDIAWEDAWAEFILWNRRLGHYEEGTAYRDAVRDEGRARPLRVTEVSGESCRLTTDAASRLPALSADYVKVKPTADVPASSVASLTAVGPPGSSGAYVVRHRDGGVTEGFLEFDAGGVAVADVPFDAAIKSVLVALGNGAPESDPSTIAYSVRLPEASSTKVELRVPRPVIFGEAARLNGTVTCGGEPAAFARVAVEGDDGGSTARMVTTGGSGTFSITVSPEERTTYSATLADPLLSSAPAATVDVDVRVGVSIDVSSHEVTRGQPLRVQGAVFPSHPGASLVVEFRRPEREWRVGTETTVVEDGSYDAMLSLPNEGVWEVRARLTSTDDTDHLVNHSVTELVVVRSRS